MGHSSCIGRVRPVLLGLVVAGCSTPLPASLQNPGSAQELQERIRKHCDATQRPKPGPECVETLERSYCQHHGGRWIRFTSGCRDFCPAPGFVQGQTRICTTDTPMGCDCGPRRCWNGLACQRDPRPAPPFVVSLPPRPAACGDPAPRPPAKTLSARERVHRAEVAVARVRCLVDWLDAVSQVIHGAPDHPRKPIAIECARERLNLERNLLRLAESALAEVSATTGDPDRQVRECAKVEMLSARAEERAADVARCAHP